MTGRGAGEGATMGQGSGSGVADRLAGLSAEEAVRELTGAAGDDMPLSQVRSFPGPVAEAFYFDDADICCIQGPVGSGKTTTLLHKRLRRAMAAPMSVIDGWRRYKLGVARKTYRDLWSTTIPSYLDVIPKNLGTWAGGRGDPVTHTVEFEDEHGPILWIAEFKAFGDDITNAMRGWQITDLWINEADTVHVDVLMDGIGRVDRFPSREHFAGYAPELMTWGQIDCDTNAPDEDSWVVSVFHDEAKRAAFLAEVNATLPEGGKPVRIGFHRQPGARAAEAENLGNLAPGYYARQVAVMKAAGRGDKITRMIDNEVGFTRIGDPVFRAEFNAAIHVAPQLLDVDPALPLLIGLDQGFRPAAVLAQFRPRLHWRVVSELMFPDERLLARTFAKRLADHLDTPRFAGLRVEAAWGDVAGEAGAAQAAEDNATWNRIVGEVCGFTVRPQRFGANRIQPRLEAIRAPLEYLDQGQPGLIVCPSCRFLRAGLSARYVWTDEVTKDGDKRKIPDKSQVEANVVDALGYLLLSRSMADGRPQLMGARPADRRGDVRRPALSTGWRLDDPYARDGAR